MLELLTMITKIGRQMDKRYWKLLILLKPRKWRDAIATINNLLTQDFDLFLEEDYTSIIVEACTKVYLSFGDEYYILDLIEVLITQTHRFKSSRLEPTITAKQQSTLLKLKTILDMHVFHALDILNKDRRNTKWGLYLVMKYVSLL